jgi:hypothetical protein
VRCGTADETRVAGYETRLRQRSGMSPEQSWDRHMLRSLFIGGAVAARLVLRHWPRRTGNRLARSTDARVGFSRSRRRTSPPPVTRPSSSSRPPMRSGVLDQCQKVPEEDRGVRQRCARSRAVGRSAREDVGQFD